MTLTDAPMLHCSTTGPLDRLAGEYPALSGRTNTDDGRLSQQSMNGPHSLPAPPPCTVHDATPCCISSDSCTARHGGRTSAAVDGRWTQAEAGGGLALSLASISAPLASRKRSTSTRPLQVAKMSAEVPLCDIVCPIHFCPRLPISNRQNPRLPLSPPPTDYGHYLAPSLGPHYATNRNQPPQPPEASGEAQPRLPARS